MNILSQSVKGIKGIGDYYAVLLRKHGVKSCGDLLWIFPSGYSSSAVSNVVTSHGIVALNLTIVSSIQKSQTRKTTHIAAIDSNGTSVILIFFFHSKLFHKGARICVHGELKHADNKLTMVHPQWFPFHKESFDELRYPIAKLPNAIVNKAIHGVLDQLELPEWLQHDMLSELGWASFVDSMKCIHTNSNVDERTRASQRIKFDEALAYQYGMHNAHQQIHERNLHYKLEDRDISDVIANFGHPLTECQYSAWHEIRNDLMSDRRSLRILYGDVGSGKTLVAFLALAMCYRSGRQGALLAPTEILASQHFQTLSRIMPREKIILLTGSKKRASTYEALKSENCIVIGTHAILQSKVEYKSLGLLVIDEQHRFGVLQRMAIDKSMLYNVLLMTATPIPRTLKLSLDGSIPITKLTTRPQRNRKINVAIISSKRLSEVLQKLRALLDEGDNIFWVCPFIEKSESKNGVDVMTRYDVLNKEFGKVVAFLHGRMSSDKKEEELRKFYQKETRILVSTTVIEVGIDIPHANTIIIENAELFGMSQLYQLMGRVGRGGSHGNCYFVYHGLSRDATSRLKALQDCKSGLELAEHDMYIRGFGNILGIEQSGMPYFRCLDISSDREIFDRARIFLDQNISKPDFIDAMAYLTDTFAYLYSPWSSG